MRVAAVFDALFSRNRYNARMTESTENQPENTTAPEAEEQAQPSADQAPQDLPPLPQTVEAALLTTDRALTAAKLAETLQHDVSAGDVKQAVEQLNGEYEQTGRSFRIEQVAGGYQIMTLPAFAGVLASMHRTRADTKLSPAAMETLAIVAYKQPIIRSEIEAIRGVACGEVLRSLMDRHLVKIVGRAEEIGRPMLYGTTKQFLEQFGLANLKDLPKVEQLKAGANL